MATKLEGGGALIEHMERVLVYIQPIERIKESEKLKRRQEIANEKRRRKFGLNHI